MSSTAGNLVCSGCHNKIPQAGWLNQQKYIPHGSGSWKHKIMVFRIRSLWNFLLTWRRPPFLCVPTCPCVNVERKVFWTTRKNFWCHLHFTRNPVFLDWAQPYGLILPCLTVAQNNHSQSVELRHQQKTRKGGHNSVHNSISISYCLISTTKCLTKTACRKKSLSYLRVSQSSVHSPWVCW